jgi:hypothetical protein
LSYTQEKTQYFAPLSTKALAGEANAFAIIWFAYTNIQDYQSFTIQAPDLSLPSLTILP